MKFNALLKFYLYALMIVFAGVVFHAPLSVWLGVNLPEYDLLVKAWKEMILVALFPIGIFLAWKRGVLREILQDKIIFGIGLYALLHILLVFVFQPPLLATISGLMIDLRYVLFFTLVYTALKMAPQYKWQFVWVGVGVAAVSVAFALLQVFVLPPDFLTILGYSRETITSHLYVDNNPEYVRINGTLRGPNPLGAYMVIVLTVLAAYLLKGKLQTQRYGQVALVALLSTGGVVALWASYSRSALVAAIAGVALVIVIIYARKISFKIWGTVGVIALVLISGAVYMTRDTYFVQHVIFHEDPEGLSERSSNEEHVESLQIGTERMLAQPLGAGVGSTGSASTYTEEPLIIENQYLFIAHEAGWPGIIIFLAIFGGILWRLWRAPRDWLTIGVFASGVGLAAIGLLQPVWVDDTVSLVWWGLAGVILATANLKYPLKKHKRNIDTK